jgi:1,4-alpha-glucan branching enzyme
VTTPFLGELDLHLLSQGRHYRTYEKLGAHLCTLDGVAGTHFAVWAPNARAVSVIGDWNAWSWGADALAPQGSTGVWAGFVPHVGQGQCYKYAIESHVGGYKVEKADPHGFTMELRPRTASRVWDLGGYAWGDEAWMRERRRRNALDAPISVYEVHLGSWMRVPEEDSRWLSYREVAPKLAAYAVERGFTHVELLPITEHPFDGSWGYQTCGYYAPTSRFGTPQDFMLLVDTLHRAGVGVLMDWVPAHFPTDRHGLAFFDGTHLYEHEDPRKGTHPHWGTLIFNFGRNEVQNFLISNALFWLDRYHLDGLRVDAVASMLYLDYGRGRGEWVPNEHGGNENLEAIAFIRRLNEQVYLEHPECMMIAEESTAWPAVSRPTWLGGLGFGLKWNMGWMHDVLRYFSRDPVHRSHHQNDLTFGLLYAFTENFMLPLSHDEVVHMKGSMLDKMPGDLWQRFANLRLLYGFQWAHPGKKLLFMGGEIGQWREWHHDGSLDWHLLAWGEHRGLQRWVGDLNRLYRESPALHEVDFEHHGFEWVDCGDAASSVVSFLRWPRDRRRRPVLVVVNATPVPRHGYRIGVPRGGPWRERLNSDAREYGGSGVGNMGGAWADEVPWHGRPFSVALTLPPLGCVYLAPEHE